MAKIGAQGRAVMAALEAGRPVRRMGDAWRAGALVATAKIVAELARHDLVREAGDALVLTAAGHGFTLRNDNPAAANRLLAERALDPPPGGEAVAPSGVARGRRVTVNLAGSPLGWLIARGMISARQAAAGERLHDDWSAATTPPRVTMRWDAGPGLRTL